MAARNLQCDDHPDENIRGIFENSKYEWLHFDALKALFRLADNLRISTGPREPTDCHEGLYIYENLDALDSIVWDIKSDGAVQMAGDVRMKYNEAQVEFSSDKDYMKRMLVRRVYECEENASFFVVHYLCFHLKRTEEELSRNHPTDSDDTGDDDGDQNNEEYQDVQDGENHVRLVVPAATATSAALAMDLQGDYPGSDVAPVASCSTYLREFTANCYVRRAFTSGFTGSAGTTVVIKDKADGHYFLLADKQLTSSWTLMRVGDPGVPDVLAPGARVGIDTKGSDVPYLIVEVDQAQLFEDDSKVTAGVRDMIPK